MTIFFGDDQTGLRPVKLGGALLASRVDEVKHTFQILFRQGVRRVVVDLADVPLIDGAGLAGLLAGYRLFGSQPQNFRLAALQEQPRLLFDLTGFDRIFLVFETTAAAIADERLSLGPRPAAYSLPGLARLAAQPYGPVIFQDKL